MLLAFESTISSPAFGSYTLKGMDAAYLMASCYLSDQHFFAWRFR